MHMYIRVWRCWQMTWNSETTYIAVTTGNTIFHCWQCWQCTCHLCFCNVSTSMKEWRNARCLLLLTHSQAIQLLVARVCPMTCSKLPPGVLTQIRCNDLLPQGRLSQAVLKKTSWTPLVAWSVLRQPTSVKTFESDGLHLHVESIWHLGPWN